MNFASSRSRGALSEARFWKRETRMPRRCSSVSDSGIDSSADSLDFFPMLCV